MKLETSQNILGRSLRVGKKFLQPISERIATLPDQSPDGTRASDFRRDVGGVADVLSFGREFLKRVASPAQAEVLVAVCGKNAEEWDTAFHEVVLLVGMKGGKNFVCEWIVAYMLYKIGCLVDAHAYFTKITKRAVGYTREKSFDIVNVSSVDEVQARRFRGHSSEDYSVSVEELGGGFDPANEL